jgi:hypothetical protein
VISATEPINTDILWVDTSEIASNTLFGNAAGNINMAGYTLQLDAFAERVHALGNATGTITPDFNNGTVQTATVTGNITLNSLANVAAGSSMTLIFAQDATGNRVLSSDMKWSGGFKTLSTAANAIDVVSIFYDGTNYLSSLNRGYQ